MLKQIWPIVLVIGFAVNFGEMSRNSKDDIFGFGRNNHKTRKNYGVPFPQNKERKPNIVLILTDDQDVELGSLNFMPQTLKLIRDQGAEFRHAYTTTPMCCPSRSSLLTGLYMHNHHVYTNNDNCSSTQWQTQFEPRSFATYLSNAGYRTGYFGKYLNKYNGSYIPPGWREWGGLIMNSRYYNYSVNLNGKRIRHGDDYEKDYYPDLIANDSVSFLKQSKKYFSKKPVLLVASFPAPHGPEDSAPQYSNMFFNVTTHHTPSYDYAPNPDKQWILQVTGKMQPIHKDFTDLLMTKRLQTLQSVDDAVYRIYNELEALGELDNTYFIYTSDHGYHLGQFGLVKGKSFPFEFDIRVPFLVRGPGIEPGSIVDEMVLNIDLAPTFLDIGGVEPPSHMDGRSIVRLLNKRRRSNSNNRKNGFSNRWPDTFLVESSGRREVPESLVEAKLQESIVKVEKDLNQTIAVNDMQLDNRLVPVVVRSKSERLEIECRRPEYQAPCKQGQKWECVFDGYRWRKLKCKIRSKPISTRKCVCFTPTGFMYTKFQTLDGDEERKIFNRPFFSTRDSISKDMRAFRPKSQRQFRSKRSLSELDKESDILSSFLENIDLNEFSIFFMENFHHVENYRHKRSPDTSDSSFDSKVSAMMGVIEDELNGLQDSNNRSANMIGAGWNCTISTDGSVDCNDSLYKNPRSWKQSQHKLTDQIKQLKLQLEKLKDIRKFLRERRPPNLPFDRSNEEEDHAAPETDDMTEDNGECEDDLEENVDDLAKESGDERVTDKCKGTDIEDKKESDKDNQTNVINLFSKASTNNENLSISNVNIDSGKKLKVNNISEIVTKVSSGVNLPDDTFNKSENNTVEVSTFSTTTKHHRHNHHQNNNHRNHESGPTSDTSNKQHNPVTNVRHNGNINKNKEEIPTIPPGRIDVTILEPVLSQKPSRTRPMHTQIEEDKCFCEPDPNDIAKEEKRRLKDERQRKRERKLRRKAKLENICSFERMNCFNHDNEHWRTPPLWTSGPFCFCMNANNNTYSCLRTINATHNYLYCEFVTGLVTFYNLRIDPFEQWNRINSLTPEERSYLHDTLEHMKGCKGRSCTVGLPSNAASVQPSNNQRNANHNQQIHTKRKLVLVQDNPGYLKNS